MSYISYRSLRSRAAGCVLCWVACGACALSAAAASPGVVVGSVTTPDGEPAMDTRVILTELNRSLFVDERGTFRFEDVPAGRYHLQAVSRRYGNHVQEIEVGTGGELRVDVRLERLAHSEMIVVTAGAGRGRAEVYQPVNVLEQADLVERLQPTLGETLSGEAGVRSTYFGPGASRPVIRGQSGGRIRILEGGLDVGDASSTSPDHAVASDPAGAEKIEILRGPATLLYGSTAVGGVVNILDQRVPDHVPQQPFGGTLNLRYGSAADERSAAIDLGGGAKRFAWHWSAFNRDTDDYDIPGPAVRGDASSPSNTLPNSALESEGATLGGSWVGPHGFLGAAVRTLTSLYGIPAQIEGDEESAGAARQAEDGIRIDLEQRRYDLRGGFARAFGPFDGLRFSVGATDYEHRELEGATVGTRFLNDALEGRLELRHGQGERVSGVVGLQFGNRDFEAIGAEAFVPPSKTDQWAVFALEEIERGPWRYELGVRVERQEVGVADPALADRDFSGVSGSAGLVWLADHTWSIGASLARTVRLPSAEELYSDGPHLATFSFERGDVDLDQEVSLGLDVGLRRREGRWAGELNLFFNRYGDFIFEDPTSEIEDGLPVFEFRQGDAEFYGFELQGRFELFERESRHLDLELLIDHVRAELTDGKKPLPRIPPLRASLGLRYSGESWRASLEVSRLAAQDRVAEFETTTDGYTLVTAGVGYRIVTPGFVHELLLRGNNLTDELARNHSSRLKDLVPLPARDVGLVYRMIF